MAILVLLALLVGGTILLILPALVPGLVLVAVGTFVYRSVLRHRHPGPSARAH